jgi:glucokinase
VHQDPVRMTNSNWVLSRERSARRIGVRRLYLFNDFEALALALPSLREHDVEYFGNGKPDRMLPMAVIGPGTGLGVAACVPTPRGWIPLSGEGGHVTVSAASAFESELIEVLRAEYPHISAERLLSGIGLPVLYGAVCAVRGTTPAQLRTEAICDLALADADDACVTTLDTFCAMLGTFAGNVALTVGARGGVFIAGGIAPRLGRRFTDSRFRERFEAKGRFAGYMASIATGLITAPHAALAGAAQGIANDQTPAPLP